MSLFFCLHQRKTFEIAKYKTQFVKTLRKCRLCWTCCISHKRHKLNRIDWYDSDTAEGFSFSLLIISFLVWPHFSSRSKINRACLWLKKRQNTLFVTTTHFTRWQCFPSRCTIARCRNITSEQRVFDSKETYCVQIKMLISTLIKFWGSH